jgi:uncharacterized SAM-binding protein YcdF (DUF218 family)
MFELAKLAGYLLSPLTIALLLALAGGVCFVVKRRTSAAALVTCAFAILYLASTPWLAMRLIGSLERQHPALSVEATPVADAIVVLGGALVAPKPPQRPTFLLGPGAGRIWHAAALFRAGKAPWVVISGGNQPGDERYQAEGDVIAGMLIELGVPETAIRRETRSRNTRENAQNVRELLTQLQVRRILLVTSGQHMPRAVKTFAKVWAGSGPDVIPVSTDIQSADEMPGLKLWLPSLEALNSVSKGLKEFAGIAALAII